MKKQKRTNHRERVRRRHRLLFAEIVILFFVTIVLFFFLKVNMISYDSLPKLARNDLSDEVKKKLKGYQTIVLFGVDNRSVGTYDTGRSDSIMICSIDNKTKEVKVASIYRDTFLDMGEDILQKANYAYNMGGAGEAITMLNRNLDLDIQDYVSVDFCALADAVDAVGGVDLSEGLSSAEAYDMNTGHNTVGEVAVITGKAGVPVTEGQTHLDGVQAVAYCRVRYVDSDFIRAERQRRVLKELVRKAKAADAGELDKLATAIFPKIATSLSVSDILGLASVYRDYELAATTGFPFDKRGAEYSGKGEVVVPCTLESNVAKLHLFLYENEEYAPSNTLRHISGVISEYTGYTESSAIDFGRYDTVDVFEVKVPE